MEISSPLCITSRLLPGVRIGGAEISIEYMPGHFSVTLDSRQRYRWHIDLLNGGEEFRGHNLTNGRGRGTLQEGLESLLGFLGAFAEAHAYEYDSENSELFPPELAEWAAQNITAIAMLEQELQDHPNKLIVE